MTTFDCQCQTSATALSNFADASVQHQRLGVSNVADIFNQLLYGKLELHTPVAVEVYAYGNGPTRNASVIELEYVNCCMEYLQDNELVSQLSQNEYVIHSDDEQKDDEEMEER